MEEGVYIYYWEFFVRKIYIFSPFVCLFSNLIISVWTAAAAAKSLQSCPTLCDPIDGSPPGSTVPGILQARVLEWDAIAFSNQYELVDIYFILWVISNNTLFNLQILPLLTFGSSFRLAPVFFWHTYLWQTYICLLFLLALFYFLALEDVFWHTYLTQVLHFLALEDPISSSCIFP